MVLAQVFPEISEENYKGLWPPVLIRVNPLGEGGHFDPLSGFSG